MGDPRIDSLHDQYEDQLSAARYKAERDQLRQELQGLRERNLELWMDCGMSQELVTCAEDKAERLGKLVWRLQNRLARSHRREKALRKGMRMWRKKAISRPVHTVSAYDLLSEGEREVLRMWPRYEDGEPVRFGDRVKYRRGTCAVESVRFYMGGGVTVYGTVYGEDRGAQFVVATEPVMRESIKRARHQVLAADGEPLEVGQTVYTLNDDRPYTVKKVEANRVSVNAGEGAYDVWKAPTYLTHQRPVLDADGVPIKKGDTVWHIKTGREYVVVEPSYGETVVVRLAKYDDAEGEQHAPDQLTHTKPEPPDSWERIEEDAKKYPCHYFGHERNTCDGCPANIVYGSCKSVMTSDLVRRCKALAEKENRNE